MHRPHLEPLPLLASTQSSPKRPASETMLETVVSAGLTLGDSTTNLREEPSLAALNLWSFGK